MNILESIVFSYITAIGFLPYSDFSLYDDLTLKQQVISRNKYFINLKTEIEIPIHLGITGHIGGDYKQVFKPIKNKIQFFPTDAGFNFFIAFKYKHFKIRYSHYCTHPVLVATGKIPAMVGNGSFDEISISLSGKFNPFK